MDWGDVHPDLYGGCMIAPLSFEDADDDEPQHLHLFVVPSPTAESAVVELSDALDHKAHLVIHEVARTERELIALVRLVADEAADGRFPPGAVTGVGLDTESNAVWVRVLNRDPAVIDALHATYGDALVYSEGWPSEEV